MQPPGRPRGSPALRTRWHPELHPSVGTVGKTPTRRKAGLSAGLKVTRTRGRLR